MKLKVAVEMTIEYFSHQPSQPILQFSDLDIK
jgi:hypothetical protein